MIGEVLALSAAISWAISAILYKKALKDVTYLVANLYRSLFASLFLLILLLLTRNQSMTIELHEATLLVLAGIGSLGIGDTLYFIGLKRIGVSRTQSITSSYPLYSVILAILLLNETYTSAIIIGVPLIVFGVITVSYTKNKGNPTNFRETTWLQGVIASLGAAFFWSVGLVTYKIIMVSNNIDLFYAMFIRMIGIVPFLILTVILAGESTSLRTLSKRDVALLAIAGIVAVGIGGTFIFVSLSLIEASRAIPISSISPLLVLLLASIFTREKITAKITAGTLFVVTGVIILTFYIQN